MANTHATLRTLFSDIADAIRAKSGSAAPITADDFAAAISNISLCDSIVLQESPFMENGHLQILLESSVDGSQTLLTEPAADVSERNIVAGKTMFGVTGTAVPITASNGALTVAADTNTILHVPDLITPKCFELSIPEQTAATIAQSRNINVVQSVRAYAVSDTAFYGSVQYYSFARGGTTVGVCAVVRSRNDRSTVYLRQGSTVYTDAYFPAGTTYQWTAVNWSDTP